MWAGVAEENELAGAHRTVLGHLNASLAALRTNVDQSHQKEKESKDCTAHAGHLARTHTIFACRAERRGHSRRGPWRNLDASEGAEQKVGRGWLGGWSISVERTC